MQEFQLAENRIIRDCYCDLGIIHHRNDLSQMLIESAIKTKETPETSPNSGFFLLYAQTIQQSRHMDYF